MKESTLKMVFPIECDESKLLDNDNIYPDKNFSFLLLG